MAKKYALFIALILVVSYFSLTSGSFSVRPAELLSTLFQIDPNPQYEILLFDLRLPRVVMAAIIGLGLGIAGAVIQAITRNGLADPGILGINAGAGAGIVAFMLLFQGQKEVTSIAAAMGMPLFGLIGGLIAAILIYIFAWHRGNLDSGRIILVGIAINSGFSALSLFLSLKMDPQDYQMAMVWKNGSIWSANWTYITAVLPWMLLFIPILIGKSRLLDTIRFDEDTVRSLGISSNKEKNHPARSLCSNHQRLCLRSGKHGVCRLNCSPYLTETGWRRTSLYPATERFNRDASCDKRRLCRKTVFSARRSARRHHFGDPRSSLFLISAFQAKKGGECLKGSLSEHKAGNRRFTLYLPPSYSTDSGGFPAVYVQDGSSLFQNQIELLENAFQQRRLPKLVLIGIEPENRLNEYTPWPAASLSDRFTDFGGMGYHYLSDITNQFIPLIEENWNVTREPQSRGMIGASLGGLISMFAILKYPSMFGKIGSISGSYWYENAAETIHITSLKPGTVRVFMSVGSEEGREKQSIQRHMLKKTKQVHQSLKEKGFTEDQLYLSIEKGAVHHRKYFCKQFINALEWLYGKNRSTL